MNAEIPPRDAVPPARATVPRHRHRVRLHGVPIRCLVSSAATLMALCQPCAAALITQTYNFSAAGFRPAQGTEAAPVDPVTGSVTVSFDTSESRFDNTTGVVLNSLDLPEPGSALAYTYRADLDQLVVGGVVFGAGGISANLIVGGDDFFVVIDNASTSAPTFAEVAYVLVGHAGQAWASFTGNVSVAGEPPASVPEPHALALALTGLLASAAALRRGPASLSSRPTEST